MGTVPNSLFLNYPVSTGMLIICTIVFSLIGTISFYKEKWTL